MVETIYLKRRIHTDGSKGRLFPCLPSGEEIPQIVRGSLSITGEPDLFEAGYVEVKMKVIMKITNIDGADFEEFKDQIEK